MTLAVWKYPLQKDSYHIVDLPVGAEVLSFQMQQGVPTIWALVDVNGSLGRRMFRILATGESLPDKNLKYIGSVQDHAFVWHLFEQGGNFIEFKDKS